MSKREKSKRFEPVGKSLAAALDKLGLSDRLAEYQAVTSWAQAVGPKISEHSQAHSISRGTLVVLVESSAWLQELTFLKPDIVKRLNAQLGRPLVREIRLVLGRRPFPPGHG